jgi:hypothetical protein
MLLTAKEIAQMIDLSCVRTISNKADIEEMVNAARTCGFGQVSVLQCFIPYTRQLLQGVPSIHVVGNVSFPSGSDSTSLKVVQAKEMMAAGCDEIDMVMTIGKLRSFSQAIYNFTNPHAPAPDIPIHSPMQHGSRLFNRLEIWLDHRKTDNVSNHIIPAT